LLTERGYPLPSPANCHEDPAATKNLFESAAADLIEQTRSQLLAQPFDLAATAERVQERIAAEDALMPTTNRKEVIAP
jgi:hypothetical protein